MMIRKTITWILLVSGTLFVESAFGALKPGPGKTPFWISISSPQQIDEQVAHLLSDHAMVVALRMPDGEAQMRATVAKLKHEAPHTPVLMYAWASRNLSGKPGSAGVMDWLDQQREMQIHVTRGHALDGFGDVSRGEFRSRVASGLAAAVERRGFDGVALDLAVRTPRYRPVALARICATDADFCTRYAQGMDATFDAIRGALGNRSVLYNGLWNFGAGSVADQQQLLDHSDAAIIEYFGGNPKSSQQSFSQDILPYLEAMAHAPDEKKILVFGRGSIQYTSYADDYARQRYLYCAYLLGARDNIYFKYHSTFQADASVGRSGGLSVYADWSAIIGTPVKAYGGTSSLYSRSFTNGLVIVAPDDGNGGVYQLPHRMYSPEGDKYEGRVNLRAGQGLVLLDGAAPDTNDQGLLDLKLLADWPSASAFKDASVSGISMQAGAPVGSHDMLLDAVRTPHPRNTLQLRMLANGQPAQIQVVAEVDDPQHQHEFALLTIHALGSLKDTGDGRSISFRSTSYGKTDLPVIDAPLLTPGVWQTLKLDGRTLLARRNLTFKRWDYVRFDGAIKLASVGMSN